jgi:hypothetical protein
VLALFVLPGGATGGEVVAAFQGETGTSAVGLLQRCGEYGKVAVKYLLVLGYVWLVYGKVGSFLRGRKLKRG